VSVDLHNGIAGKPTPGRSTFAKINPVDGSLVAKVHEAGPAIVNGAVSAARCALNDGWPAYNVTERTAFLRRIADGIDERFDDFVAAEATDTGKPVSLVRELDVFRVAANFRSFADTLAMHGLIERAQSLRLGRPEIDGVTTGPLISHEHRARVQSYYDLAGGSWIEHNLWTGLTKSARVVREEIFGPTATLIPFDTESEAIALANDTDYGLAAAVWTTNLNRGHRVAGPRRVGTGWAKPWFLRELRSPFGGVDLSGIGREGGQHSLHFYTEPTNVCVQL